MTPNPTVLLLVVTVGVDRWVTCYSKPVCVSMSLTPYALGVAALVKPHKTAPSVSRFQTG
jgi:hypothetical protein